MVQVRFVSADQSFFVLGGEGRSDWVSNALRAGTAKVRTQELVFHTLVSLVVGEERVRVVHAFASKYGSRIVKEWYSNPSACLRLDLQGSPTLRGVVKGEGDATTTYTEWLAGKKGYYAGVSEAFDSASEEYDFTISHNYINTWIRKRSISELLRLVKPEDTLLEIGCGTGAEAVEIAKFVSQILATDISEKMIGILRKKIQARNLIGKIIPLKISAADIAQVSSVVGGTKVQAAYSFNGALNCEPNLGRFVEGLSHILIPGGHFICSLRNSFCLSEALSHAVVFQFDRITPRKTSSIMVSTGGKQVPAFPVMVSVGGRDIPAFYYTPGVFAELFEGRFTLQRIIGLPALLPPAYLSDYYVRFKNVGSILEKFEWLLGGHFPFNRFGDQTLFVFQNR